MQTWAGDLSERWSSGDRPTTSQVTVTSIGSWSSAAAQDSAVNFGVHTKKTRSGPGGRACHTQSICMNHSPGKQIYLQSLPVLHVEEPPSNTRFYLPLPKIEQSVLARVRNRTEHRMGMRVSIRETAWVLGPTFVFEFFR